MITYSATITMKVHDTENETENLTEQEVADYIANEFSSDSMFEEVSVKVRRIDGEAISEDQQDHSEKA